MVDGSMIADTSTAVNAKVLRLISGVHVARTATRTPRRRAAEAGECCPSVLTAPLDAGQATELARGFGALADPVRLRLLSLIAEAGEICSCELEAPLARSQPTISHHTRALAEAGLVVGEKRGRWMWWRVVPERVTELRRALE